ncbi:MAG TPA: hypothetical protein VEU96_00090 [Bryobacteraceae bacterium]|nr:hypothetical protein [Bryobacteraceae bacterium]
MSRRANHLWALGACFALLAALAIGYHPGFAVGATGGLSAPAPPKASLESAPIAKLLQSHFDWYSDAPRFTGLSIALSALHAYRGPRQGACVAPPLYGPLHRRPPPNFS